MNTDGAGQLFGPGRLDGPFPEHYEPAESPVASHPFSSQLTSPCFKFHESEFDKFAAPADPRYPIVLTTYSMTEHWCGGGETSPTPGSEWRSMPIYFDTFLPGSCPPSPGFAP